jgi:hypothetical protein
MTADRPYGEFCDFHSSRMEYFGYTLVVYYWVLKIANWAFMMRKGFFIIRFNP